MAVNRDVKDLRERVDQVEQSFIDVGLISEQDMAGAPGPRGRGHVQKVKLDPMDFIGNQPVDERPTPFDGVYIPPTPRVHLIESARYSLEGD